MVFFAIQQRRMREKVKVETLQQRRQQQQHHHHHRRFYKLLLLHHHPNLSSHQINPRLKQTQTFVHPKIKIKAKPRIPRMLPHEVPVGTTWSKEHWMPIQKNLVQKRHDYSLKTTMHPLLLPSIGVDQRHNRMQVTIPTSAQATILVEGLHNPPIERRHSSNNQHHHHLQCEIIPTSYP